MVCTHGVASCEPQMNSSYSFLKLRMTSRLPFHRSIYICGQSHSLVPTSAKERDVGPVHKFTKPDGPLSLSGSTGQTSSPNWCREVFSEQRLQAQNAATKLSSAFFSLLLMMEASPMTIRDRQPREHGDSAITEWRLLSPGGYWCPRHLPPTGSSLNPLVCPAPHALLGLSYDRKVLTEEAGKGDSREAWC